MKTSKKWLCALATALGCAMPVLGFCDEAVAEPAAAEATSSTPLVKQVRATSRWDDPAPPTPVPEETPAPAPTPPATNNNSCPIAQGGCESCCAPPWRPIVLVEATFFWPQFNRNFLTNTLTNTLGTETVQSTTANGSAEGSLLAAPRITAGFQGECWGLVGRYWYAQTWASAFAPSIPGDASNGLIAFDGFRAYTADLELQRRFCWCNWDMYGFGGVRYASVNNDRTMVSTNSFGGPVLTASSFAAQQFNGTGLTWGLWGTRPIWCDDSPFKLFFVNRYSTIWGNGSAAVQTTASSIDAAGSLTSTNGAAARANGDLFIVEVQLGIQWDACLKCIPGRAFVRSGLEYQYWDGNAGIQAGSTSFATVVPTGTTATSSANAGDFRFNLIGFNIGAGILY